MGYISAGTQTAGAGTTQNVNITQVGGAAFSLGQQLAAASLPVVLTAAQLTTLTPPTSVTVTQATGSNLHTVLDSGTLTTVSTVTSVTQLNGTAPSFNSIATGVGKNGLDINVLSILGTAPTTAGFIDIKGADGNVFVRQATASNLNATVVGTGTFAVQAALNAETTKVIGVVRTSDGAGNLLTSNSTTFTSKFALDSNILGTLGTAFTDAGKVNVQGGVATNVAVADKLLNLGAQAVSAENTAVTATRMAQLVTDLVGKLIVLPYANPENFVSGRATATDTTSTSLLGAPAAGLRNYITQITVWNSSAVSTYIKIQDGSGGTELYDIPAPAGGGATLTLPTPLRQPTTATAIFFAANASANAVFVSASGYKGA